MNSRVKPTKLELDYFQLKVVVVLDHHFHCSKVPSSVVAVVVEKEKLEVLVKLEVEVEVVEVHQLEPRGN